MNTLLRFCMQTLVITVVVFTFLSGVELPLAYYQPDKKKTSFEGYSWGDSYLWYHETTAGYRFMLRTDGWYHYVSLDTRGDYKMTPYKVGIDTPPAISYKLERSAERIAALEDSIAAFYDSLATRDDWWQDLDSIRLGIVLVTFPDAEPYNNNDPDFSRPNGFTVEDFEKPLFTHNHGYSDSSIGRHEVFGSMRDYYLEQTNGEVKIYGNVVNPTINDSLPDWYMMPDSIAHYSGNHDSTGWNGGSGIEGLIADSGADTLFGDYDAIVIVYSSHHLMGSEINPEAVGFPDPIYTSGEKSGRFDDIYSIGVHCHEFGHLMGRDHLSHTPFYYSLMVAGNTNSEVLVGGYRKSGTCPASIDPYHRINEGWYDFETIITQDTIGLNVIYDYDNPRFYKIPFQNGGSSYFYSYYYLLENRQHDGFDEHTPIPSISAADYYVDEDDVTGNKGGLLIWQVQPYFTRVRLLDASGTYNTLPGNNDEWGSWVPDRIRAYTQIPFPLYQDQSIDNNTGHLTTHGDNLNSRVIFRNIHWNAADSSVTLDIYTNGRTGDLSAIDTFLINTTLYDTVSFSDNVYIPAGVTVTVLSGATISMPYNKKIEVKGNLVAIGTASDPITFTSITPGSSNRWYRIYVTNGGEVTARYVEFNNAKYGVYINDASSDADIRYCDFTSSLYGYYVRNNDAIDIRDCTFKNNTVGIRLYYSDCDIYNNDLDSNMYGIYGYYSDFDADENEIHDATGTSTSRCGIYLSHSNPSLDRNDISNCYKGIRCYNYSGPDLTTHRDQGNNEVNNYIHDNNLYGVYVSSYSTPDLGVWSVEGKYPPFILGGFNYFTDNESYDIYNSTASTLYAQVNWWDDDTPDNYGSVNTSYQADVVMGMGPGNLPKDSSFEELFLFYQQARLLEKDSLFLGAVALYDSIIVNDAGDESNLLSTAMIGIQRCYRSMDSEESFVEKMDVIRSEYPNQLISTIANYMAAGALARIIEFEAAIGRFETSVDEYDEFTGMDEQEAWALFDIGQVSEILEESGSGLGKASKVNNVLLTDYPDSEAAEMLRELLGMNEEPELLTTMPAEFKLNHPYPNPFNPSTTIQYELPKTADVTITIYDILGRNVWSYEESAKPAGYYSLQWNGVNNNGKLAASGIYLISFSTPEFRAVQKAVLIR